jgi:hypothetical protein
MAAPSSSYEFGTRWTMLQHQKRKRGRPRKGAVRGWTVTTGKMFEPFLKRRPRGRPKGSFKYSEGQIADLRGRLREIQSGAEKEGRHLSQRGALFTFLVRHAIYSKNLPRGQARTWALSALPRLQKLLARHPQPDRE